MSGGIAKRKIHAGVCRTNYPFIWLNSFLRNEEVMATSRINVCRKYRIGRVTDPINYQTRPSRNMCGPSPCTFFLSTGASNVLHLVCIVVCSSLFSSVLLHIFFFPAFFLRSNFIALVFYIPASRVIYILRTAFSYRSILYGGIDFMSCFAQVSAGLVISVSPVFIFCITHGRLRGRTAKSV